jgi:hypothetical protein
VLIVLPEHPLNISLLFNRSASQGSLIANVISATCQVRASLNGMPIDLPTGIEQAHNYSWPIQASDSLELTLQIQSCTLALNDLWLEACTNGSSMETQSTPWLSSFDIALLNASLVTIFIVGAVAAILLWIRRQSPWAPIPMQEFE